VQLDKQVRKSLRRNGSYYGRTIAKENRRSVTSFALPENRHTEITEMPDITNSLGQTFSSNSSSNNYSTKFQAFRNQAENQHLKFKSNNLDT